MAAPTALYRFRIELADIDHSRYESLDFRVAQHPSETLPFLLTRVLAFSLNAQDGLEFSTGGLSDPDAPCMSVASHRGGTALWIEVGNPSTRKLHKAAKAADRVRVYTYKNADLLLREMVSDQVHKADAIDVFSFRADFLSTIADWLERENRWSLTLLDGSLTLTCGERTASTTLEQHRI